MSNSEAPYVRQDEAGHTYVLLHPRPDLVSVPLSAGELVVLWNATLLAASRHAEVGDREQWQLAEQRASLLLLEASRLEPTLLALSANPPHHGRGGTA